MVMLGVVMIAVAGLGIFLYWKKRLFITNWYMKVLMFVVPIPYLANELGWAGAEIGRQPWIIYKVLRTSEASSLAVPMWQTAVTVVGLTLLYTFC
jgi:cytochrome d ubiquinol oxidase subunit I